MQTTSVPLQIGSFDPEHGVVLARTGLVRLAPCEARLLAFLAANPGKWFSVETLLRDVWGYARGVSSRTAYVTLGRLRAKVEADATHPRHVVGERHLGYRFEPLRNVDLVDEARLLVDRLEALGWRVSLEPARAAS